MVRSISGAAATKTYRCPGCRQEIPPGTPHVVAWPAGDDTAAAGESGSESRSGSGEEPQRRHWHTGCWRRAGGSRGNGS